MLTNTEANYHRSRTWLRASMAAADDLAIPTLALAEVAGAISRRRQVSVQSAQRVNSWILQPPNLQVVPLHRRLALRAADIAATYRLRGADAVYVAAADELGVTLVTWDTELQQRAATLVNVVQP